MMDHEIVQDLLPLYHDGVCSPASRAAVEEHLKTCETCQKALTEMDAPLPPAQKEAAQTDGAAVEKIVTEWKRGRRKSWIKGAVIAVALCVLAFGAWFGLTQVQCVNVDLTGGKITEVSQLKGQIVFHVEWPENFEMGDFTIWEDDGNGDSHLVSNRAIFPGEPSGWGPGSDGYFAIDIAAENAWGAEHGKEEITRLYLGTGENAPLIWEKGMDLPSASDAARERYAGL